MLTHLRNRAFTLVELLIVVVVLGILAGIVLPSFSSSTEDAKLASMIQNLQTIRASLDLYKVQHGDMYPGYPSGGGTPTEALLNNQLSLSSKKDHSTAAIGTDDYNLGPYMKSGMPANPFNGLKTVKVVADATAFPTAADDTTGWVYKPKTGQFKANLTAESSDGTELFDY